MPVQLLSTATAQSEVPLALGTDTSSLELQAGKHRELRVREIPPECQNQSGALSYTQVTGEGAGELHSPSAE